MQSVVSVHNQDDVSLQYWQATSWRSLQCYYMQENPGDSLKAPFILDADNMNEEQAYKYFRISQKPDSNSGTHDAPI